MLTLHLWVFNNLRWKFRLWFLLGWRNRYWLWWWGLGYLYPGWLSFGSVVIQFWLFRQLLLKYPLSVSRLTSDRGTDWLINCHLNPFVFQFYPLKSHSERNHRSTLMNGDLILHITHFWSISILLSIRFWRSYWISSTSTSPASVIRY